MSRHALNSARQDATFRSDEPGAASLSFYALLMVICGEVNAALWYYAAYLSKTDDARSVAWLPPKTIGTHRLPALDLSRVAGAKRNGRAQNRCCGISWRHGGAAHRRAVLDKRLDGSARPKRWLSDSLSKKRLSVDDLVVLLGRSRQPRIVWMPPDW